MAGNLFDQAMDKIRDEMAKRHDHGAIQMLGEHLTALLLQQPEAAAQILQAGKTLAGAYGALEAHAKKQLGHGGCVVISDAEGFKIMDGYFGIGGFKEAAKPEPAADEAILPMPAPMSGDLDWDALLGG